MLDIIYRFLASFVSLDVMIDSLPWSHLFTFRRWISFKAEDTLGQTEEKQLSTASRMLRQIKKDELHKKMKRSLTRLAKKQLKTSNGGLSTFPPTTSDDSEESDTS